MAKRSRRTPGTPPPTLPLTAHPNGQRLKKILGEFQLFGVWADPEAARPNYLRIAEDLHAGGEPADQHALHRIIGQSMPGMSGDCVEEISLERLHCVTGLVRSRPWPMRSSAAAAEARAG